MHRSSASAGHPLRTGGLALIRRRYRLLPWRGVEVLLVRPTYVVDPEHSYQMPGGAALAGEPVWEAVEREVLEEIGRSRRPGRLLAVDYVPGKKEKGRAPGYNFVLDFGFVRRGTRVVLPAAAGIGEPAELDDWAWVRPCDLDDYCQDHQAARIREALEAARPWRGRARMLCRGLRLG
ncbi:NUDIX domain-containing protein [Streptomyces rimosus]|uniref:NUDIX domain-containing protein n=1 Tax=Streptomyces rimosus TaxID=1927 RepID=UPI000996AA74|nr:NUDIX domain-containing protein [Streptomyces rimosus]